jgi:CubicO group peptidase (beta-lactamase class C family)
LLLLVATTAAAQVPTRTPVAHTALTAQTVAASSRRAPDLAALDRYVAKAAQDWHVPGLAIAVVHDDSLVFAKGYGVLEIGKPARVNEHTRFAIGSTTKAMTVAALAMLVDEGKLSWDEHIIDLLPKFRLYDPWVTREITIRDLLTHRSGLPGTDLLWVIPQNQYTMPEMIRRLRYVKPESSFRSQWEYQNVMYAVAGYIVAQVSGMPWEDFIKTRIFGPLNMNESIPLVAETRGQPNVATPHGEVDGKVQVVSGLSTDAIAPAGSVYSSVSDMSKWMRFILDSGRVGNKRLIQPATFNEIVTPQIQAPMAEYPALELARPHFFSYGFAWFIQDYRGQIVWMHTGSINGMCAIIGLLPAQHVGVYVLENLDHAELRHALMYKVFDMYEGNPPRDWSADLQALFASQRRGRGMRQPAANAQTATQPPLPLVSYVGAYVDSTYGTVQVTLNNDVLHARFENLDMGDLDHVQYEVFRARPSGTVSERRSVLTFVPDGAGHISAVRAFGITFSRLNESNRTQ